MNFLKAVKNTYKKSEAAVVVQNLLEIQAKAGHFNDDPAQAANKLIGDVWDKSPHLFDGRFGQRPHKISVAAVAISNAINDMGAGKSLQSPLAICLGNILSEIEVNGKLYPLNNLDADLIESAFQTLNVMMAEFESLPIKADLDFLLGEDRIEWDEWFSKYKQSAGVINPGLEVDKDGRSLIDFMDDEPIRRAYNDGVDPIKLGAEFGEGFDVLSFGK